MGLPAKKQAIHHASLNEQFKAFPILKSFPDQFVDQLARFAEVVILPEDAKILVQGQMNEHLYFLVSGKVGIYVDGGCVSQLQKTGDMLGEMSVISNRPVGATIISETEVSLFKVNTKEILDGTGPQKDLFASILYRIYSSVLVEKLDTTNQKAKYFEELNGKLTTAQKELREINENLEKKVEERTLALEQQNAALLASKNKTEDILNGKRRVFAKLAQLNKDHLLPLKNFLDDVRKLHPLEQSVEGARQGLFEVQHLISPIVDQQATEEAIEKKKVLFADTNKKQQIIAKTSLGGTGVELDIVSTVEEGNQRLQNENYDLVVFGIDTLELGNLAIQKNPNIGTVLMTSDSIPTYLPALRQLNTVPHIVSRDELDRTFTVKNILTTVTKLLGNNIFGLEKYLSWGVDIQSKPIFSSSQRAEAINEVDRYFEKLGVRSSNRDRIRLVLEEMLMNAIYDAPVDSIGQSVYNHLPRTVAVTLKPSEQGVIRFATDGMLMAVSVQDPFGSLRSSTILKYLEQNYQDPHHDINQKLNKGGAGRGLHQIVENSDLVVFNLHPGVRTEVITLFNVDLKEKVVQNSSFHLFVKSSDKK